jgi:hypothetical protein
LKFNGFHGSLAKDQCSGVDCGVRCEEVNKKAATDPSCDS